MNRKSKNEDLPPVYEVDVLPVERRLFPRGRRTRNAPLEAGKDRGKVVLDRRTTPGRRKSDREPPAES